MKVDGRWRRAIELADDGRSVIVLDQARLPYETAWLRLDTLDGVARAIRDMHVRGAPLIGAAAAYGIALARRAGIPYANARELLLATRPTAINLRWALDQMQDADDPFARAAAIADDEVARCEAIG